MRAAKVVQQLCKSCRTCFMFYFMFYFTCDRSFITANRDSHYAVRLTELQASMSVPSSTYEMSRSRLPARAARRKFELVSVCHIQRYSNSDWTLRLEHHHPSIDPRRLRRYFPTVMSRAGSAYVRGAYIISFSDNFSCLLETVL